MFQLCAHKLCWGDAFSGFSGAERLKMLSFQALVHQEVHFSWLFSQDVCTWVFCTSSPILMLASPPERDNEERAAVELFMLL